MLISHRRMKRERAVLRLRPHRGLREIGKHLPLWQRLVLNRRMIYIAATPMPHRMFIGTH